MKLFLPFVFLLFCNLAHCEPSFQDKLSANRSALSSQLKTAGIKDMNVIKAITSVPREDFIPKELIKRFFDIDPDFNLYDDRPLKISNDITLPNPQIVALMTELLDLKGTEKVLEVGTGTGYHTAILSKLSKVVYTIELSTNTAENARKNLSAYKNVTSLSGDGYAGLPEKAPFDCIIVTCAPDHIPQPLIDQLADGGRMIIPVGTYPNELLKFILKKEGKLASRNVRPVSMTPMKSLDKNKKQPAPAVK